MIPGLSVTSQNSKLNFKQLPIVIISYVLLYTLLFPSFRHLIDPDATAYISIAEKLANGNYMQSINGIRSPLGSWLLAPFIRFGFDAIITGKILTGFYGLISLCLYFFLVKKMKLETYIENGVLFVALLLMLCFSFLVLFGDMLLIVFLLAYLNILCSTGFGQSYKSLALAAFVGGLAFYAKAYAFYFTLFHLPLLIVLLSRKAEGKWFTKTCFKKIAMVTAVLFMTASFWFYALKVKYGHFILGQKYITGTLSDLSNPVRTIVYPPAPGNYAGFDDISNFNQVDITPFSSLKLFMIQTKLIVTNFFELVNALNEISFAFFAIVLISVLAMLQSQPGILNKKHIYVLLSFIAVWIPGFLFFSVQSRFLWIINLIALALGAALLSAFRRTNSFNTKNLQVLFFFTLASFCIYPLTALKKEAGKGEDLFKIAEALKRNKIQGRTFAIIRGGQDYSNSIILNYLSGSTYYGSLRAGFSSDEILKAIQEFRIEYLLYYYSTPLEKENFISGKITARADLIFKDIYPGIVVLSFKN